MALRSAGSTRATGNTSTWRENARSISSPTSAKDGLTDCDFRQPKDGRIDNIAGACAACGLLELANVVGGEEAETYRAAAMKLLTALNALCADWTDGNMGILQKCTASYHNDGASRHVNILYGDYFFIEALCKLRGTDARLWMAGK